MIPKLKIFSGLTKNSFLLSFTSLFADISTEMLYPILPIFLTQILHTNGEIIGIVTGLPEAIQNITQGFSGWLSDILQKRKKIALCGYILAALSKPLLGFSQNWQQVLAIRFFDRVGTGMRSAPRDGLIAESVAPQSRGKAFGIEGVGDNLGACIGPLITIVLLFRFHISLAHIFFFAIIPGILAVCMIVLVKESPIMTTPKRVLGFSIKKFPISYWKYLFVTALFGIGNSSNSFLILQTKNIGVPLLWTILIYTFFTLCAALISYPSGYLSDRIGRRALLICGLFLFFITYTGFAFVTNFFFIGLLFSLYGVSQGIFRSVGKAFATDFVPSELHASSLGLYSATIGLTGLLASVIAGFLWDSVGHNFVFLYASFTALLGILGLVLLRTNHTSK